jgi:4-hydroxy-2-oxoheptanedioate aldolase
MQQQPWWLWIIFIACLAVFASVDSVLSMKMTQPSLRQYLKQGGKSYGPLLLSDSPIVAEILALSGYGHIVVDHEHGPTDLHHGQSILLSIEAASLSPHCAVSPKAYRSPEPIVRLPGPNDPVYMKKVLDSLRLPGGVLVPMVEDAKTAAAVVQATRFPLDGIRGCAIPFIRATNYGAMDREEYLRQCREDLLVMVQVESSLGVSAIPEIAQIDGIDGIFLGPLDLSASIGKMGQFRDDEFLELLANAEQSILESGCLLAGFRTPGLSNEAMFDKGYSLVCGSVDLGLLRDAARLDALNGQEAISSTSLD